jgi:hypothetical protein
MFFERERLGRTAVQGPRPALLSLRRIDARHFNLALVLMVGLALLG